MPMLARWLVVLASTVLALACGSPVAAPPPTQTAPPAAAATAATARAPEAGELAFQVQPGSKAVVRVREQLAGLPAPGDAVLETADV
ncbi:MAG: hypothetical protein M3470_05685, partial [Chloroflexota bacterium]|nr:hypothetical protein [Chloroflexota bacterium]